MDFNLYYRLSKNLGISGPRNFRTRRRRENASAPVKLVKKPKKHFLFGFFSIFESTRFFLDGEIKIASYRRILISLIPPQHGRVNEVSHAICLFSLIFLKFIRFI